METRHLPVLLNEVRAALRVEDSSGVQSLLFDGTLGGGGHSEALLEDNPCLLLWGMDRDEHALARAKHRLRRFAGRTYFAASNFAQFEAHAAEALRALLAAESANHATDFSSPGFPQIFDRVLLDLGLSSDQLDEALRGFSFLADGPLDMRLDRREPLTAEIILNEYSEQQIFVIFKKGGLGQESRALARAVVKSRPLHSTAEFRTLCQSVAPRRNTKHSGRARKDPATVPFQALRMAVNRELESLESFLGRVLAYLKPGGRLAVISFHSLEDKAAARTMRAWAKTPEVLRGVPTTGVLLGAGRILTPKAICPSEAEVSVNPRARSARMRVFEKLV